MHSFNEKLIALKKLLMTEEDFRKTYNYFFEHLGNDQHFIDSSVKTKNPFLKSLLNIIKKQIFKDDGAITNLMLLKLPKTSFYHGSCFLHGKVASIIYFEDIEMGMAAIHLGMTSFDEIRFVRITGTILKEDKQVNMPISMN